MKKKDAMKFEDLNSIDAYEFVSHPEHYNSGGVEVIDMMERIWGTENTITFCHMNAFKYRMRIGIKPGQSIQQDVDKANWYTNKANQLKKTLQ
jgi:hypothetical protein